MRDKARIFEELLVMRAQAGDRGALDQLVRRRHPRMLAHAARLLGNADQAADAVQQAWMDILRGLSGLRDPRAFPAWSLRIVTRKTARTIDGARRQRELAGAVEVQTETVVPEDGPAAVEAAAVRRAVSALPPAQAATVALFYLEDMSIAEVAMALDIPPGTVKTRLMHARAALRAALDGGKDD
ncbi:RNA polymerase sigma factor [Pseudoruegeria sp. HB172150]|uniref:RNA polymerase sigma factor n=1 Tax=Pseudoruegeria sp. HB172150 TaxID=2721164 RepID=UPI001556B044|nr:RNA polymerase sigma factor [Pseudoruegeria sp. HB172150]